MAPRIEKVTEYLRHTFSDAEMLKMGREQAQAHSRLAEIELEFDSVKASFKSRTEAVEATIGKLSRNINNCFEMRNIECILSYDNPNVGEVTYVRADTGEIVRTRAMTDKERQMEIPLEASANDSTPDSLGTGLEGKVRQYMGAPEMFSDKPRMVDARETLAERRTRLDSKVRKSKSVRTK